VTFVVIPLFAAANVGIDFSTLNTGQVIIHPVTLGVIAGLVLGKFLGIGGMSWLVIKAGIAHLPTGVTWHHLLGAAWLSGIGFTMALFISQLAFAGDKTLMEAAKLGILSASFISACVGLLWLLLGKKTRDVHV